MSSSSGEKKTATGTTTSCTNNNKCQFTTTHAHHQVSHRQKQQEADLERQLKTLLPAMESSKGLTQIDVMEHAAAYIERLQNNLIGQIRTHGYPEKLRTTGLATGALDDRETIKKNVDKYVCTTMQSS